LDELTYFVHTVSDASATKELYKLNQPFLSVVRDQ